MLWVFDWDGTLIDSMDKIVRCMQLSIAELDMPLKEADEIKNIIGLSMPVAADVLFPGITGRQLSALVRTYKHHFTLLDANPCELYDGVESGLAQLKARGDRVAVATGKSRHGLDSVLERLGWQDYFDATRCADETKSKPHPLMLNQILAELGASPKEAVMVGDTEFDLQMAANAGVAGIGVTYGAHSAQRLKACSPVLCVNKFAEVMTFAR